MPVTTGVVAGGKGIQHETQVHGEGCLEIGSQEKESDPSPVQQTQGKDEGRQAGEGARGSAATSGRSVSRNQSKAATTSGRKSRSQVY